MRIDNYTKEMMDENSFIDMAHIYLEDLGKEADLYDIIDKFKEVGNYSDDEIESRILQFYTDLNTDGRFLSNGEGVWGLRDWYSVSDISEKIAPTVHKFELAADDLEEDEFEEPLDKDFDSENITDSDQEDLDTPLNDDEDIDDKLDDDLEFDETDDLEDDYDDEV